MIKNRLSKQFGADEFGQYKGQVSQMLADAAANAVVGEQQYVVPSLSLYKLAAKIVI